MDEKFGTIKVRVRSPPAKGKANDEIETIPNRGFGKFRNSGFKKEFGKVFGSGARIISGHGRREKSSCWAALKNISNQRFENFQNPQGF